ncbi:hypothetical protein EBB54_03995 [Schaedlerella arabinosiphila]|uniref:ABC transporter ATP-binding protein n=1 Tax=Schaedlerella arabinosiphila TaxID=2044587 RepID=A0A426DCR9_9FIRM|nr:hypothetical protein [Schaedlerella arabinosiphila]RRK30629.1 hypothetical protein EBB54_03995 [Schaedlerella arabinosiphila]
MKESKTFNNTLYCIKYIWKIDKQYILLMITISVLTSIFNVINLSILRYITNTLMKKETGYFLGIIGIMFLLSTVIAVINGSASYLFEPLLQNRIVERIQKDIYTKAKKFSLEEGKWNPDSRRAVPPPDSRFLRLLYPGGRAGG